MIKSKKSVPKEHNVKGHTRTTKSGKKVIISAHRKVRPTKNPNK